PPGGVEPGRPHRYADVLDGDAVARPDPAESVPGGLLERAEAQAGAPGPRDVDVEEAGEVGMALEVEPHGQILPRLDAGLGQRGLLSPDELGLSGDGGADALEQWAEPERSLRTRGVEDAAGRELGERHHPRREVAGVDE